MTGHRASRAFHSERDAWQDVRKGAQRIAQLVSVTNRQVRAEAHQLVALADSMLRQLDRGIHENSPLTVMALANPPARGGKVMSRRLYTIEYRHARNGKDYYHNFKPGTEMVAMSDGTVLIRRKGSRVWADLPGE